jgi:hypothetical protein
LTDPDDPKVTYTFERNQDRIVVKTHSSGEVFQLVAEYAFGWPNRYVTMVGRGDDRQYRAARYSYYHSQEGTGWCPTFASDPDLSRSEKIRGEPVAVRDGVARCLYCHVTRSRNFRDPPPESGLGPEAADAGIGCERCHGPGGNHLAAVKGHFKDLAIADLKTDDPQAITAQCADCHVVGSKNQIAKAPDDPRFVRSTAITLTFSRCYTESNGALSCVTCHDPHRDDVHSAALHEEKCLTCHSQEPTARSARRQPDERAARMISGQGSVCPVNAKSRCLECHMPKVRVPALKTSLTDHYIRVRGKEKDTTRDHEASRQD